MEQHQHRNSATRFQPKWGLLAGGVALAAYGFSRGSKAGTALATAAGVLAFEGARSSPRGHLASVKFRVNASREEAYALWRDFAGAPRFMAHIETVRVLDTGRSEWTARGHYNSRITWTAEILEDVPNERIKWRSEPGSLVDIRTSVQFETDPQGRGSIVSVHNKYSLPVGPIARGLITLVGRNPQFVIREDLRRFKALLETGEMATTRGQTHGPRGLSGKAREEVLFRESANMPPPQAERKAS